MGRGAPPERIIVLRFALVALRGGLREAAAPGVFERSPVSWILREFVAEMLGVSFGILPV
jgi:hypothetical protein